MFLLTMHIAHTFTNLLFKEDKSIGGIDRREVPVHFLIAPSPTYHNSLLTIIFDAAN